MQKIWSTINEILSKKRNSRSVPLNLKDNSGKLIDPSSVPDAFNNYVTNIPNANSSCSFSQSVQPSKNPRSMFFSPTDRKEVLQVIKCLSNSSKPDFFGISNKLLRTVSSYVCGPIVHIANLSMTNGVFPEIFKSAIVIPIHKKGDPSEISNYRPISLLPVISKVLERINIPTSFSLFIWDSFFRFVDFSASIWLLFQQHRDSWSSFLMVWLLSL